ncbi:hypothetical protein RGQ29_006548 [Quercus rubra]|uniref:Uncharacterized protein n=1 Tax=Quercus rubra TaxID=3512 RepID=A0AAN7E7G5_QUERU|nr:hypothetical protein RGQ29_006548 [Quercus rubra]
MWPLDGNSAPKQEQIEKHDVIENAVVSPLQGLASLPSIIFQSSIKVTNIEEAIEEASFLVDEFPEQDISVCQLKIKGMACTSLC